MKIAVGSWVCAVAFISLFDSRASADSALDPWRLRLPLPTNQSIAGLANGAGTFVGVGAGGTVVVSTNGSDWVSSSAGLTNDLMSVSYGDGDFVAVGEVNNGLDWRAMLASSTNGLTWNARLIEDFQEVPTAVNKANGTYLIATHSGNIWRSADGSNWTAVYGNTNSSAPVRPPLQGIAFGASRYVAVGKGLSVTSSNGLEWTAHQVETNAYLNSLTFGGNLFVAVGAGGTILSSPDGMAWTSATGMTNQADFLSVAYGDGRFVAVGLESSATVIVTSTNGLDWVLAQNLESVWMGAVCFGAGIFIVAGEPGQFASSADGVSWTNHGVALYPLQDIAYGNHLFVATAFSNVLTSSDGVAWVSHPVAVPARLQDLVFSGGRFFSISSGIGYNGDSINGLSMSADGTNWEPTIVWTNSNNLTVNLSLPAYGLGSYVVVGNSFDSLSNLYLAFSLVSSDGHNWIRQPVNTKDTLRQVVFANNKFFTVGWTGAPGVEIFTSPEGTNWVKSWSGYSDYVWGSLAFGNGRFVTATMSGFLVSQDGVAWQAVAPPFDRLIYDVAFANGLFVASAAAGYVLTSTDATNWEVNSLGTYDWLWRIASGNGTFLVVANQAIYQSARSAPPRFTLQTSPLPGGDVQVGASDAADQDYTLRASTNLLNWQPIAIIPANTQLRFVQTNAAAFPHRYYRADFR